MIDLHSHILPEMDDGAENLDMSLTMLSMASKGGTTTMVATPHVIGESVCPEWETIVQETKVLNREAACRGIAVTLYPGAEVAIDLEFLNKISGPGPYCLNGGRYMLVELPAREIPGWTDEFFFYLQTKEIIPILAHPERHPEIQQKPEQLLEWIHKGILVQINAGSLKGQWGTKVKKAAQLLVLNQLVHAFGSDAHSTGTRNPNLGYLKTTVQSLQRNRSIEKLFGDYPSAIVNDRDFCVSEVPESLSYKDGKWNGIKNCLSRWIGR
ncbi:MAG: ywqE [Firmicutes bacterium]|nr:ywqE [Bacillota bacterium]